LNRDFSYGGTITNQLNAFSDAGYLSPAASNVLSLRALVAVTNSQASREWRTRSYLAANCAHCHQPGGSAGFFDSRFSTPTVLAGLLDGPLNNNYGDSSNGVVKAGSLDYSMLYTRINGRGPGQMPPLSSNLADTNALNAIAAWITNEAPAIQTYAAWQILHFGSTNDPAGNSLADPGHDLAVNYLEYLAGADPQLFGDAWKAGFGLSLDQPQIIIPVPANRGFEAQGTTNLPPSPAWRVLESPQNRPFFPQTNTTYFIGDPSTGDPQRFYRVRLFEF
jgi:mono/diheme cytochrome c family protein